MRIQHYLFPRVLHTTAASLLSKYLEHGLYQLCPRFTSRIPLKPSVPLYSRTFWNMAEEQTGRTIIGSRRFNSEIYTEFAKHEQLMFFHMTVPVYGFKISFSLYIYLDKKRKEFCHQCTAEL